LREQDRVKESALPTPRWRYRRRNTPQRAATASKEFCLGKRVLLHRATPGNVSLLPYKEGVAGSNPASPTLENRLDKRKTRDRNEPRGRTGGFVHQRARRRTAEEVQGYYAPSSFSGRTTNTGKWACRTTEADTLPISARLTPQTPDYPSRSEPLLYLRQAVRSAGRATA